MEGFLRSLFAPGRLFTFTSPPNLHSFFPGVCHGKGKGQRGGERGWVGSKGVGSRGIRPEKV